MAIYVALRINSVSTQIEAALQAKQGDNATCVTSVIHSGEQ
jgi:hypothetical protein